MTGNDTDKPRARLDLRSQLSDIAQVPVWIKALASKHGIPGTLQFAMNLCLEEVVSNIIRHGYAGKSDRMVRVVFSMPQPGSFVFVVDDDAPHFNPLEAAELPSLNAHEEARVGGQGIRLLRRFADTLNYEPTPTGNRFRMRFSTHNPQRHPKHA